MRETPGITPALRTTVVFVAEPDPVMRCSHCESLVTDDDADCPTCQSPIDWGASMKALRAWQQSSAGESTPA